MKTNKIHITHDDITWGSYTGGYQFFVDCINTQKDLDKCVLLENILFDEYHLFADVDDDLGILTVCINSDYTEKSSYELEDILITEINKLFEPNKK